MKQYLRYLLVGVMLLLGIQKGDASNSALYIYSPSYWFDYLLFTILSEEEKTMEVVGYDLCRKEYQEDEFEYSKIVIPAYVPSETDADVVYTVTAIGEDAFLTRYCGFTFPRGHISAVEIPETVERIGACAFSYTYLMKEIRFPDSVSEIGGECVAYSSSLEYVKLPEGLKVIPEMFAKYCEVLHECVIPESVEIIGTQAFAGCRSIEKVYIPAGVKSIGNGAFGGMDMIESFEIDPDNEDYCVKEGILFDKDMKTLVGWPCARTEVVVPEGMERIAGDALNFSNAMTSLDLPASITDLSGSYFDYNKNLKKITVRSLTAPICTDDDNIYLRRMFAENVYAEAELWVPEESYEEYKAHPVWGKFVHIRTTAGVNSVADDEDAAPSYYSLDGRKVDAPEPGSILIRRSGSTAEKIRY